MPYQLCGFACPASDGAGLQNWRSRRTPCFGGSTKRWLPALPRFLATVGPGWRSTDLTLCAGGEDNAKGPPTVRRHAGWRVLFFAWPQRPALARRA